MVCIIEVNNSGVWVLDSHLSREWPESCRNHAVIPAARRMRRCCDPSPGVNVFEWWERSIHVPWGRSGIIWTALVIRSAAHMPLMRSVVSVSGRNGVIWTLL